MAPYFSFVDDLNVTQNGPAINLTDVAFYSDVLKSTLNNSGMIFGAPYGVWFDFNSVGGVINNSLIGTLEGSVNGIRFDGEGVTINNFGGIAGGDNGVLFGSTATASLSGGPITLNNHAGGKIWGGLRGVYDGSDHAGATINNSGLIHGFNFGVLVDTNAGLTTIIKNNASGTIEGFAAPAIETLAGSILLDNSGTVHGNIVCMAFGANDRMVNKGQIIGTIQLGPGNDTFNGRGGMSGTVFGEVGNDSLRGGSHKDFLVGGLDKDALIGGKGADKFIFNDVLESAVGANRDLIFDFSHAQHDKIDLHAIDANSNVANDQAFQFIGAKGFHGIAGELRYGGHILQGDVDGNGAADFQIQVNARSLVKGDFIL